jgi:hypothetical protein
LAPEAERAVGPQGAQAVAEPELAAVARALAERVPVGEQALAVVEAVRELVAERVLAVVEALGELVAAAALGPRAHFN